MSYTITLPAGASGVRLQGEGCYWSFSEMTASDQGFKLGTGMETVWVHPAQSPQLYVWVPDGIIISFQSVSPMGF